MGSGGPCTDSATGPLGIVGSSKLVSYLKAKKGAERNAWIKCNNKTRMQTQAK